MSGIIPIPTTRVGDFFVRQRLTDQVQLDQLGLFRLQNQISTGQRLQLPSDDAPAAGLRAINLQRLLDRKGQIGTNLQASNFYLSAAENSLGVIGQQLSEVRAGALGVADTVATPEQRQTVVQQIDRTLQLLIDTGNAKSQGRYLFAGSRSQNQAYGLHGDFVEFLGNDGSLRSYVDMDRLFATNLSGPEVFGGVSSELEGSVDLNPQLTDSTLVSTLNGGNGIGRNPAISVSVTTGVTTSTNVIDLSRAVTVGDIARLIEEGAAGDVRVNVTGTGLVIQSSGGPISISEVAQGNTARQLGILSDPNVVPTTSTTGGDLNPAVLKTTQLSNLLGKKAQGVIQPAGNNNDIRLVATENGTQFNGTVQLVGGGTAGSETATYNPGTHTLTVQIDDGRSTANDVAAAITAEGTFTATGDYHDATAFIQIGTAPISLGGSPSLTTATSGGIGEPLDTESGLILTNGGESVTLDISGAQTVEELLNLITGAGLGLVAEINSEGDGINVRSRLSGADFTIGENGGATATQLGIRSYTGDTKLSALNRGAGVTTTSALETLDTSKLDAINITARNGVLMNIDLSTSNTLQDVVAAINSATGNHIGTTAVTARVTADGNGVELVDSSTSITGALRVEAPLGTQAAQYLGFVSPGTTQQSSTLTDLDSNYTMSGMNVLGHDMAIVARDGTELWIDLAGTETVQDVIDRINSNPNASATTGVSARLARTGNGIELVDSSSGSGTLTVRSVQGSEAAKQLGFVAEGQTESDPGLVQSVGGDQLFKSEDRHTLETDSVFNTLLRLKSALEAGDVGEIGRAIERLDEDASRVNFARSEIGARLQNLEVIGVRFEDENVQLQGELSQEIDVDLVEAISNLTARQYAFEASLRTSASLMQMSLLNFL